MFTPGASPGSFDDPLARAEADLAKLKASVTAQENAEEMVTDSGSGEQQQDQDVLWSKDDHYENCADKYEEIHFYSPGPYNDWAVDRVYEALDLSPVDGPLSLMDVGGGTGIFTEFLVKRSPGMRALVFDNSASMLAHAESRGLQIECGDAMNFGAPEYTPENTYDRILMKEVSHHLHDRTEVFHGLRKSLNPGGKFLIVTRPKFVPHFPLFKAAAARWAERQPAPEDYIEELIGAGFKEASILEHTGSEGSALVYNCEVPLKQWLSFVRNRGWSVFDFDDAEIEAGCAEIESAYPVGVETENGVLFDGDKLRFKEIFTFILATV